MSRPETEPGALPDLLDQQEWYQDSSGNLWKIADMEPFFRACSVERLLRIALPLARTVYRDLYSYGYPSGEQAQWEVDRGEAEAEHIMASAENAQEWIRRTPLYEALKGEVAPVVPENLEESTAPPQRPDEQSRVELAELDEAIERTRQTLKYLEELRGRLA